MGSIETRFSRAVNQLRYWHKSIHGKLWLACQINPTFPALLLQQQSNWVCACPLLLLNTTVIAISVSNGKEFCLYIKQDS